MASDKDKIVGGMVWKLAERFSSQGITFVISIILARLLMPSEYGVVAMINIFITLANVFVVAGFNSSLIQKKDADEIDFSTIFYCTLAMSLLMYGIMFGAAPYIADFYDMPDLCLLTRVFSLSLIINSYQTIQQAFVARRMIFKKNFYATFSGTFISGVIGVIMAYNGFGVWSLVVQHISNILINTFALSRIIDWKPKLVFSMERAKPLMSYGSKILASTFIATLYKDLRQLLVGSYYSPADLAYLNRASHFPYIITTNLDNTLRSVLFPAMSNRNDDVNRVKHLLRRAIKNSSYITFFFLTLMAVMSESLVRVLLTEKWIQSVPYMRILCVSYMLSTVSISNVQALKAIGKSNDVLRLELLKKPLFLVIILFAVPFGVKAIVYTSLFNSLYALYMNIGPTQKHLNYGRMEQLKDLFPGILLAGAMATITFPLSLLPYNDFVIIILQLFLAVGVYISCSILFKIDAYYYIKELFCNRYYKRYKRKK